MVKLVDTSDLKSAAAGRAGSIPARGTISFNQKTPLFVPSVYRDPGVFCCLRFGIQHLKIRSRLGSWLGSFAGSFRHSRPAQLSSHPLFNAAKNVRKLLF